MGILGCCQGGPRLGAYRAFVGIIDELAALHKHGDDHSTFLMVFIIQNTQNREAQATQLKLDERIRAIGPVRDSMIDIEALDAEEFAQPHREFTAFRAQKIAEIRLKKQSRDQRPD